MPTPRARRPIETALCLTGALGLSLALVSPVADARPKVAAQGAPPAATTQRCVSSTASRLSAWKAMWCIPGA